MTTEEKLKALGFKKDIVENSFCKSYTNGNYVIYISFNAKNEIGFIKNVLAEYYKQIHNFKELLKLDDFYEKQAKKNRK